MVTQHSQNTTQYKEQNKITIADVAESLGISKTTVSRAISGKGRIGEATRKRVLEYIEKSGYRPSVAAKGLAQSKTYNIGWVMPGDSTVTDLPFFQRCMMGIIEVAAAADYDVLITLTFDNDVSQLKRVIWNKKVDGIILGRTLIHDACVDMLKESDIPFVVIGSSLNENVIQIDNDHIGACTELTSILLMKGISKIALIGGDSNHVVNQTRLMGFKAGLKKQNMSPREEWIYMDSDSDLVIERVVDDILRRKLECIVCMDDRICVAVLNKLQRDGIQVPEDVKVASFYNSELLTHRYLPVTALQYDPKELGAVACRTLFDYIEGKEVQKKVLLSYEVLLKNSTK